MRILIKKIAVFVLLLTQLLVLLPAHVGAQTTDFEDIYDIKISPIPCQPRSPSQSCPVELKERYRELNETCAASYEEFLNDPVSTHYWIEDPKITAQGKADERARQFIYWVLNTNAIDESPVLRQVWNISSVVALVGVVLVAAIFGIGYIISRRTGNVYNGIGNFFAGGSSGITVGPTIIKLGAMLLYVAFSAAVVFLLIQFSEILMRFFFENLGGKDLFNIYFTPTPDVTIGATERSYVDFVGCRDLNIRVTEAANAQLFMLKLTNVTYYVMGVMLLLRKILLWFMLFVAPFLALLMPFVFIRNTGWIWIGVFFQWLMYGPLMALFLGATALIWKEGIPFSFDFSRVGSLEGYVYPTAIIMTYGGPSQIASMGRQFNALNNGSYIDTFAEYAIAILMLWAVTFFPWWLLRIFRDYCCEGIYAMKNILLAMYDTMRSPPPTGPGPVKPPILPSLKVDTPTRQEIKVDIASLNEMKKSLTRDLTRSLSLQATKITDIARVETNKQVNSVVNQNLALIANPVKAKVPAERQQFMNLRSELFNRAIKNDSIARTILASTSTATSEKTKIREEIIRSLPQTVSVSQVVTHETHVPHEVFSKITNTYTKAITNNAPLATKLAKSASTDVTTVNNILNSYNQYTSEPVTTIVPRVARDTNAPEPVVRHVLQGAGIISKSSSFVQSVAESQKLTHEQVSKVIEEVRSTTTQVPPTMQEAPAMTTAKPVPHVTSDARAPVAVDAQGTQSERQEAHQSTSTKPSEKSTLSQVAEKSHTDKAVSQKIIQSMVHTVVQNDSFVEQFAEEHKIKSQQVKNVLNSYAQNVNAPTESLIQTVNQSSGVPADQVVLIIQALTSSMLESQNIVGEVAKAEGVPEKDVQKVMQDQLDLASEPEKHIEKTITIPKSVSLEDYEEVKDMWTKQYEDGEVPETEDIKTRREWVEQEVVYITNTLNKILSSDDKLQQDGLDELGYLLPIFLINSLNGEELIVYLKAKLEAAKLVMKMLDREEKVKKNLEEEEEEVLVDLPEKEKEEAPKHLEVEDEQDKAPQSIEDREKATQEKLAGLSSQEKSHAEKTQDSLQSIKNKLDDAVKKGDNG